MNHNKNESGTDRLRRIIFSLVFFILGFFWLSSSIQIVSYVLSLILLVTSSIGFCPLYRIFRISTYKKDKKIPKICWVIFTIVFLSVSIAGSYYSIFFTDKIFLEDYNKMNNFYKQTLLNTGKEKRAESIVNYDLLVSEYGIFLEKYSDYHPYSLRGDIHLNDDLDNIYSVISSLKEKVYSGNLKQSHLDFEKIRPIFQDILKRNGFSMLAVSLVDFHDVMEKVIESADSKDQKGVASNYLEADVRLKEIEVISNDSEIREIRKKLDEVKDLAEKNEMDKISAKAAELKNSFIKVYMKRG
ncbi:MAG: DUF2892 domain-containing protein [Candidatus Gracilibacteria bacterium]|nr:DUF2892 domain-containing protein [Candidatus Gracilibacteria bacterium]